MLTDTPSSAVLEAVFRLRANAWRSRASGFPQDLTSWSDAFDASARHFVILEDGTPVASARVTVHDHARNGPDGELYSGVYHDDAPAPVAVFSRIAIDPARSAEGLAERLDFARIQHACWAGCQSILTATHSGPSRWRQLRQAGFRELHRAKPASFGPLAGLPGPVIYLRVLN